MRTLGIDYGTKRVGIALSDETNVFALPVKVIQNSSHLLEDVVKIATDSCVQLVVLGESKDFKGKDNAVMKDILRFKEELEGKLEASVVLEPEFMTSHAAERFQGKTELLDASAAALILQSYLDRLNNK
jgi:putative Holliday junction resolvase